MKPTVMHKIKIDKRQSTPHTIQISQAIKQLLIDKQIKYLEQLPDIDELSAYLAVDQLSVKQAYQRLLAENMVRVDSHHYFANYVYLSPNFYLKVSKLYDVIKDLGLTPSIKTVRKKVVNLPKALSIDPRISLDKKYILLKRIYYGNEMPLAIMDIYLPEDKFGGIEDAKYDEKPLYEAIFFKYGNLISSGKRTMSVVNLSREDAKVLNSTVDNAVYQVVSASYDQKGELIDVSRSISTMNQYFEVDFDASELESIINNHVFYI